MITIISMSKKLLLIPIALLIFHGCSKTTPLCSITTSTTGQNYTIEISKSEFTKGEEIVVNMNSPVYTFGQAKNVSLYFNEIKAHDFGSWLYFSGNSRTFIVPSTINSNHCYTLRVTKEGPSVSNTDDDIYVSSKFRIL